MARIPVTVVSGFLLVLLMATPAAAHSGGDDDVTNFRTKLQSIEPAVQDLDVEVIENGQRIQVTNTGSEDVIVLGYEDEPYLRIGRDGVEENRRSPATYLNQDRQASTPVPSTVDPEAEPEWERVSRDPTARWHDHRIHWMGGSAPPVVEGAASSRNTVIQDWVLPMEVGDERVEASGDLTWVPGPSRAPWLIAALVLMGITAALVGLVRSSWWPLLGAVGVLLAADVVHAVGVGFSGVDDVPSQLKETLVGSHLTLVGWIVAGVALVLLRQRPREALIAAAMAGVLIAFNGGIVDLDVLDHSQLMFAWPTNLARVATVVALGVGPGVVIGCGIRIYRAAATRTALAA